MDDFDTAHSIFTGALFFGALGNRLTRVTMTSLYARAYISQQRTEFPRVVLDCVGLLATPAAVIAGFVLFVWWLPIVQFIAASVIVGFLGPRNDDQLIFAVNLHPFFNLWAGILATWLWIGHVIL